MEADIPLPDELEWLEAQSHIHEEYSPPPSPDDNFEDHRSELSPGPAAPDGRKRPFPLGRSDSPKRTKVSGGNRDVDEENDDDDSWLRYSPPPHQGGEEERNLEEQEQEEEVIVSRYASRIDGECMAVTGLDGERVYTKVCRGSDEGFGSRMSYSRAKPGDSSGFLVESVSVLLERSEKEALMKALHASSEVEEEIILPNAPMTLEKLWVDKYAPKSFTELLSDEQTNREVLLWLKQWDPCVFGSEIRSTADEVLSALRRHSSVTQHKPTGNPTTLRSNRGQKWSRDRFGHPHNSYNKDHDTKAATEKWAKNSRTMGTPEQKVLLLCGSPGLGKTTLAHVAAKHCGYRVVEINASDDRSSAMVEAKIHDVVQMESVTADSRPKCLIIDEIDGALGDGKGAVDAILKMVLAEKKLEREKNNVGKEKLGKISSKKRHKTSSLLRPVICICNDLYTPALRQLRQVAKVHIFVQPSVSRIVSRLKHVCNKEGMKTSSVALTALAEFTECDIRSCLNTLQFLNRKKEALSELGVSSQVVGRKDVSRNIFDIWKEIFQKRKIKQERRPPTSSCQFSEFDALHSLISSRGDYDLVFDGVYENLLHLSYHDPVLQKTVACLDSIGTADLNHQYMMRSQQMHLLVYQPSIAIKVHNLIAQVQKANIEWPKSFQRYRTMLMERIDTLRSWHNKMSPLMSRHFSIKSFVEDSVSQMLHVLSPANLRPVAVHLMSNTERVDLAELISKMLAYCITYKSISSEPRPSDLKQGMTMEPAALAFDPPIYDYVTFKDHVSSYHVLPIAMKQVLVHEVEKQKILRGHPEMSARPTDSCNKENENNAASETGIVKTGARSVNTPAVKDMENGVRNLSSTQTSCVPSRLAQPAHDGASSGDVKRKPPRDAKKSSNVFGFFERFRKLNGVDSPNMVNIAPNPAISMRDSHPVLFKFNEGFTNAIKRPVRIREFLL